MEKEKNKGLEVDYSKINIYRKKAIATMMIGGIVKSLTVSTGKSIYRAVSELDVLPKINEVEEIVGLTSYATSFEIIETSLDKDEDTKKTTRYVKLKVNMVLVNTDNPEEKIDFCGFGEALDYSDKGCGKAQTYAQKYALLKFYKVPSGDDSAIENINNPIDKTKVAFTLNMLRNEIKKQDTEGLLNCDKIYKQCNERGWKYANGEEITDLSSFVATCIENKKAIKEMIKENEEEKKKIEKAEKAKKSAEKAESINEEAVEDWLEGRYGKQNYL